MSETMMARGMFGHSEVVDSADGDDGLQPRGGASASVPSAPAFENASLLAMLTVTLLESLAALEAVEEVVTLLLARDEV